MKEVFLTLGYTDTDGKPPNSLHGPDGAPSAGGTADPPDLAGDSSLALTFAFTNSQSHLTDVLNNFNIPEFPSQSEEAEKIMRHTSSGMESPQLLSLIASGLPPITNAAAESTLASAPICGACPSAKVSASSAAGAPHALQLTERWLEEKTRVYSATVGPTLPSTSAPP